MLGSARADRWRARGLYDTESLCIADGVAYVGIERRHGIMRFDWAGQGMNARGRPVPVPAEAKRLPRNRGLEALGVVPAGPLKGSLVAVAGALGRGERTDARPHSWGAARACSRSLAMMATTSPDLAFLPYGDMLLLERWYQPMRGVGMRIRRIAGRDLEGGRSSRRALSMVEADLGVRDRYYGGPGRPSGAGAHGADALHLRRQPLFLQRTILAEFGLVQ